MRRVILGTVLAAAVTVAGGGVRSGQADDFDLWKDFENRISRGFKIAPVKLHLKGLNPLLVGLGSYIVNAQGGCNDCHTSPSYAAGGDPFLGQPEQINTARYLAGGTEFGPFISRNLTPRANGLPANLTWEQFLETMREGTDFKNRHPEISPLLQVMPWPVYGKMNTLDLRAIYEYLKAIPSLPSVPAP
jgi:hypothetical protein